MKNILIAIVAIAAGIAVLWAGIWYGKKLESAPDTQQPVAAQGTSTSSSGVTITQSTSTNNTINIMDNKLQIQDLKVGTGAEAKAGDSITVHYVGMLTNGTKFDSSRDRGTPFTFKLGAGQVIKGWDQGFAGMKVGGLRKLTIPSDLAYGASGQGSIPPNSTLVFEVELLGVNGKQ